MESSRKHLPPLAMLLGFSAAARHGTISKAADESGLTQGAVSRQIASLEDWVGCELFDRIGRNVALNATGKAYLAEIEPALKRIARATGKLMSTPEGRIVEIATLPSFGMRWLAPRWSRLSTLHPDLIVNISARSEVFDFDVEPFDLAIHVGQPDWPNARHDLLFSEHVVPVVARSLAQDRNIRSPQDLLHVPLLVQSLRRDAWQRWFELTDVRVDEPPSTTSVAHFLMLAQAVAAGAGAALLPSFLIEAELEAGTLVVPLDIPLAEDRSYYLVYPEENLDRPAVRQIRDFICQEAQSQLATGGERLRPA